MGRTENFGGKWSKFGKITFVANKKRTNIQQNYVFRQLIFYVLFITRALLETNSMKVSNTSKKD